MSMSGGAVPVVIGGDLCGIDKHRSSFQRAEGNMGSICFIPLTGIPKKRVWTNTHYYCANFCPTSQLFEVGRNR